MAALISEEGGGYMKYKNISRLMKVYTHIYVRYRLVNYYISDSLILSLILHVLSISIKKNVLEVSLSLKLKVIPMFHSEYSNEP